MSDSKFRGCWWGSLIGDALAMPVHWYYQRHLIPRDYGHLENYQAPHPKHPDSILFRSTYSSTGQKDDILHDQARYWGQREVHYHQFLKAGENTLNLKLSVVLAGSLAACNGYDQEDFTSRYLDFMLTPGKHRDTYVEEYHRGFFQNYAQGRPLSKCGIDDGHIGGLATLVPLILWYREDSEQLVKAVGRHVTLTHKNKEVLAAAQAFALLVQAVLNGAGIEQAIKTLGTSVHPAFGLPFARWAREEDEETVVGRRFSPACYIADAFPASLFLAVKYEQDFQSAIQANARLGGDNCHRGVVVGALVGAALGMEKIPPRWINGLEAYSKAEPLIEQLLRNSDHLVPVS